MDIGAKDDILDRTIYGYKFPLIQTPEPAVFLRNNKSAVDNLEFVTIAI